MKLIHREEYMRFLKKFQGTDLIKVVSGIRRCGKSTLLTMFREELYAQGVPEECVVFLNFEDMKYEELTQYQKLYAYLQPYTQSDEMTYIFLDEIQQVPHFEKVVDSLHLYKNIDLYITGSNAYFLSGEMATLLSGRYVELNMLPLSFSEFCQGLDEQNHKEATLAERYQKYIQNSAFPYALHLLDQPQEMREYLNGLYHTVIVKDIMQRKKIQDALLMERVLRFLFDNIGNLVSIKKIADTLTSQGRKVDPKTVERYLQGFIESLLIYPAQRYRIKGKQLLSTLGKYYVSDIGLRRMMLGDSPQDQGHILENVIYLELRRRGYTVYVGTLPHGEVDFVAVKNGIPTYYQVATTVMDTQTLMRELRPLQDIHDNHPKYLLTLDEIGSDSNYDGILQKNALNWLLHPPDIIL